ncbi:MAG: nuclear transport factor 2 family protein [Solirubrobacteraceae bacterium]
MSLEQEVHDLVERQAIEDVILKYCYYVDLQDFDAMVQEVFSPEGTDHHGERTVKGRQAIRDWFVQEGTANLAATAHAITNVMIERDGEKAKMLSLVTSWAWTREHADRGAMRAADYAMSVRYDDELSKRPEGWRIDRRVIVSNGVSIVATGEIPRTQRHAFTLSGES